MSPPKNKHSEQQLMCNVNGNIRVYHTLIYFRGPCIHTHIILIQSVLINQYRTKCHNRFSPELCPIIQHYSDQESVDIYLVCIYTCFTDLH